MKNLSDTEIIQAFGSNVNKALEEIYNRYSSLVYGVCLKYLGSREDSLDSVVEIFHLLPLKISKHKIENFSSWLYSVTKNHCLMKLRTNKRQTEAMKKYIVLNNKDNSDSIEDIEQSRNLENAICKLSNEQKTCIELFYYQKKSYNEISAITGFSVKSIKSFLQNGRIKLKKIMEE
ncbi:MAG: sigma-70 family RNA polymerase sigma factor [Bacteroidales bacterium]|nr:sigma-70 family RNA polymerase sigma factor [Bacteroidales bacterium]